jgi:hypothetical protein
MADTAVLERADPDRAVWVASEPNGEMEAWISSRRGPGEEVHVVQARQAYGPPDAVGL